MQMHVRMRSLQGAPRKSTMHARTRKKRSRAAASVVPTHLWLPCAYANAPGPHGSC